MVVVLSATIGLSFGERMKGSSAETEGAVEMESVVAMEDPVEVEVTAEIVAGGDAEDDTAA